MVIPIFQRAETRIAARRGRADSFTVRAESSQGVALLADSSA